MEDKLLSSHSLDSLGLGAPEERLRAARGAGLGVGAEAWRHRPWAGLTAQASVLPRGSRSGSVPSQECEPAAARGQHGTADGAGRLQRLPRGKPSALPDLASPTSQLLGPPRPTPHLWIQALSAPSRQLLWGRLGLPWLQAPGSSGGGEGRLPPERVQGEGSGACGHPWVQPLLVHLPVLGARPVEV